MRKHVEFQKRHYDKLAKAIRNHEWKEPETNIKRLVYANGIAGLVTSIADMLERDNANFDRGHFIRRCGWH